MRKAYRRLAMACLLATPGMTLAGTNKPDAAKTPDMQELATPLTLAEAAPPPKKVYGIVSATYATDYISRGVLLENQGVIVQPAAEIGFNVIQSDQMKVTIYGDVWSSLHGHHEFAPGDSQGSDHLSSWYEFDWWAGVGFEFSGITARLTYYEFLSPSDAFGTAKNLELFLGYNDAALWENTLKGFALSPYVKFFLELDGKAGTGSDEGLYVELGVGPAFKFNEAGQYPVTLTIPVTVGLGFSDFYGSAGGDDETFGFASIGATASVPLPFIGPEYGEWSATLGGFYYYFGDGTHDFNNGTGGGSRSEWQGTFAIAVKF